MKGFLAKDIRCLLLFDRFRFRFPATSYIFCLFFVCLFQALFCIDFIIIALNFRQSLGGTAEHVLAVL